jgi:hypothetical protein
VARFVPAPSLVCALALVVSALIAPGANAGTLVFAQVPCRNPFDCMTLWLVEEDGSGLRQLPVGTSGAPRFDPTWSHDGTRIAYNLGRELRSVRTDGSDDRLIFDNGMGPDWSPVEDLIAFARTEPPALSSDIYVIRSDGSGLRLVAAGIGNEDSVRFTADGKRLEFYRNGAPESGLYSIALDGTDEHRMTLGQGVYLPTPSPDGRYLAFIRDAIVWTVDAHGGAARSWTVPGGSSDGPLRWSPEGPKLYFLSSAQPRPPYSERTIHVADLSRPADGARPLIPGKRIDVFLDRTGDPHLGTPLDTSPPAVMLLDEGRDATAAARRHGSVISKRHAELFAFDMTGIRRVQLAVAKRSGQRGRCRFLGATRFGGVRPCSKPIFRTVGTGFAFSQRIKRVRVGRYLMAFRTSDVAGNAQRRPRLRPMRVAP